MVPRRTTTIKAEKRRRKPGGISDTEQLTLCKTVHYASDKFGGTDPTEIEKPLTPLDKIDIMIMEQLGDDARQSIRDLAGKLDLKGSTIAYHLNKLMAENILSIVRVGNPELLWYQFLIVIGNNVSSGKAESVAGQIVPLPAVKVVSLTVGKYNIVPGYFYGIGRPYLNFNRKIL